MEMARRIKRAVRSILPRTYWTIYVNEGHPDGPRKEFCIWRQWFGHLSDVTVIGL
jgi:hypothetical protein